MRKPQCSREIQENLRIFHTGRCAFPASYSPRNSHVQRQAEALLLQAEKRWMVGDLMVELGLQLVADSRIGNEKIRGISGGERRRVSIGVDVIHNSAVLLLDEPTSHLDSFTALNIMKILKSMAELQGRTMILSIHQLRFQIVELFDLILLLSNGSTVHHGYVEMLESSLVSVGSNHGGSVFAALGVQRMPDAEWGAMKRRVAWKPFRKAM